jgi:hypothetical protein
MVIKNLEKTFVTTEVKRLDWKWGADCVAAVSHAPMHRLIAASASPDYLARMYVTKYGMALKRGLIVDGLDKAIEALEAEHDKGAADVFGLTIDGLGGEEFIVIFNEQFFLLAILRVGLSHHFGQDD